MILDTRVHERLDSDGAPELMVLVDHIPHPEDMVYAIKKFSGKRTIFRSLAANGLVLHGIHNPDDPRDHVITSITDTEGVVHEFRGAWASRPSTMNKYFDRLPHIHRVLVTYVPKHFKRGYFSSAYSMEVPEINKWLSNKKTGWLFVPAHYDYAPDEPYYELQEVSAMTKKIPHELHP